jgi:hypothetical protein
MEELLTQMLGKRVAVSCGTSQVIRGEVVSVQSGILNLKDKDDKTAYVALEKISVIWEVTENEGRAGFIS